MSPQGDITHAEWRTEVKAAFTSGTYTASLSYVPRRMQLRGALSSTCQCSVNHPNGVPFTRTAGGPSQRKTQPFAKHVEKTLLIPGRKGALRLNLVNVEYEFSQYLTLNNIWGIMYLLWYECPWILWEVRDISVILHSIYIDRQTDRQHRTQGFHNALQSLQSWKATCD